VSKCYNLHMQSAIRITVCIYYKSHYMQQTYCTLLTEKNLQLWLTLTCNIVINFSYLHCMSLCWDWRRLLLLVVNGSLLGSHVARQEIQGFVDSYVNGTYGKWAVTSLTIHLIDFSHCYKRKELKIWIRFPWSFPFAGSGLAQLTGKALNDTIRSFINDHAISSFGESRINNE